MGSHPLKIAAAAAAVTLAAAGIVFFSRSNVVDTSSMRAAAPGGGAIGPDLELKWYFDPPKTVFRGQEIPLLMVLSNVGTVDMSSIEVRLPFGLGKMRFFAGSEGCSGAPGQGYVSCKVKLLKVQESTILKISLLTSSSLVCGSTESFQGALTRSLPQDTNPANDKTTNHTLTINCAQCSDGLDNDNDTAKDAGDFSCLRSDGSYDAFDDDEAKPMAQCQDGIDNDSDGKVDSRDPGCAGSQDNDETNLSPQCNDGLDNDNDGAADFPADFSCSDPTDTDEAQPQAQCGDGIDNDNDGLVDSADGGCTTNQDNDEMNAKGKLLVTQKITGSSDISVKNAKNINLFAFEVTSQDFSTFLQSAVFKAKLGSLANGTKYALWMDTDNNNLVDTIVQNNVSPQNGRVTFNQLAGGGILAPATQVVRVEVHMDVASSLIGTPAQLQLEFATQDSNYITGENAADGADLVGIKTDGTCNNGTNCEIIVTTANAIVWTLRDQGTLFVSQNVTPTPSRQLLGGTLGDSILSLKLHADYEGAEVTLLVFSNATSGFSSNVNNLQLFKAGEANPFATATVSSCGTIIVPANSMCAVMQSQQLVAPKGLDQVISVRPQMKTDTDGAVSGQSVQLSIVANTASTTVTARGLDSSNDLQRNNNNATDEGEVFVGRTTVGADQSIGGLNNHVVLSKVTSIVNANPDPNGTAVPTGITSFGQFKFTAATHSNFQNGSNKVVLDGIVFNVNATNVQMDSAAMKFFNKGDSFSKISCVAKSTGGTPLSGPITGAFVVQCDSLSTSIVNTIIDQGTDQTFALEGTVMNAKINGTQASTLQASFQSFTNIASTVYGAMSSHIQWFDRDASSSSNFKWIDYPETVVNSTLYQA